MHRPALTGLVVGIICFLAAPQAAQAEDLMVVARFALKSDPGLERAKRQNLASQEMVNQAYAGLLPGLSFSAESGGTRQNVRSTNNELYRVGASFFGTHRISLNLNQPLYSRSALVAVKQARRATDRADLELAMARQDLLLRAASLYFGALAGRDELEFAQAAFASLTSHYELVQAQREKGLASMPDLYEARARLASVEADVIRAEDLVDDALQALYELTGRPGIWPQPIRRKVPLVGPDPADVDAWMDAALGQNLRLRVLERSVDIAELEVSRTSAGRVPALSLSCRGMREWSGGSLYGGGSDIETANFLVRLDLPIFQGGLASSRVRESRRLQEGAAAELEQGRRQVQREVRSSFLGVTRSISRISALEQAVMSQELALEARQKGFRSGVFSSVEVLDTERDLFLVRRDRARSRYEYIVNSLRLRAAVGTLSEADLLAVNEWLH